MNRSDTSERGERLGWVDLEHHISLLLWQKFKVNLIKIAELLSLQEVAGSVGVSHKSIHNILKTKFYMNKFSLQMVT